MLTEVKRRRIAREFINEFFNNLGIGFELWKNYDDVDKNHEIMSFCPIPSIFVHCSDGEPVIFVHDNEKELFEYVKEHYPERFDCFEFNEYKGHFIAYD